MERSSNINAERIINFVIKALDSIEEPYYIVEPSQEIMLEKYGLRPEDEDYNKLKTYLTRRDERVFCYELYHHVRTLMDATKRTSTSARRSKLVFQAELRKLQIGDLVRYFRQNPDPLDGVYLPDFLLHRQGDFDRQELVIEVKADPNLPRPDLKDDLSKIDQFIEAYLFAKGLFLAVNCSHTFLQDRLCELAESGWLRENLRHPGRIEVLTKWKRGVPTYGCLLTSPTLEERVLPRPADRVPRQA